MTKVFLSDCAIAVNDTGIAVTKGRGEIFLDGVRLVRNQTAIAANGTPALFHLHNSVLADNRLAIDVVPGRIVSTKTNALMGNDSTGTGMKNEPLK